MTRRLVSALIFASVACGDSPTEAVRTQLRVENQSMMAIHGIFLRDCGDTTWNVNANRIKPSIPPSAARNITVAPGCHDILIGTAYGMYTIGEYEVANEATETVQFSSPLPPRAWLCLEDPMCTL